MRGCKAVDAEKAESSDEWSERAAGYRAARSGTHVDLPEFDPVFPTNTLFRRVFSNSPLVCCASVAISALFRNKGVAAFLVHNVFQRLTSEPAVSVLLELADQGLFEPGDLACNMGRYDNV